MSDDKVPQIEGQIYVSVQFPAIPQDFGLELCSGLASLIRAYEGRLTPQQLGAAVEWFSVNYRATPKPHD